MKFGFLKKSTVKNGNTIPNIPRKITGKQEKQHAYCDPFFYINRDPKTMLDDLEKLAKILYPEKDTDDSTSIFWLKTGKDLFVGLSLYMLETEEERLKEDHTAVSSFAVLEKIAVLDDPINGWLRLKTWIKCTFGKAWENWKKDQYPFRYELPEYVKILWDYVNTTDDISFGIYNTFRNPTINQRNQQCVQAV